jgi:phenylacetate-CoA ligase
MDLIGGLHDNLSLHVLTPFSRLQRSKRAATRPTQQAFGEGLRFRRAAAGWDEQRRIDWTLNRLREIVRKAYDETIYYRELFDRVGFDPHVDFSFDDYARLPVLRREDVHEAGPKLRSAVVPKEQQSKDATGGSTGIPTEIWLGPNERGWRDSGMERFFEILGVREGSRTALLWGHHLDPKKADTLRERYQAFAANTRWFDSMRLSPAILDEYHHELERFRPACIIAYASALGHLAEHILANNYKPNYPTRCCITGAEKLWSRHRRMIEEAFGRPVHERYGSRDAQCIGVQLRPEESFAYTLDWANVMIEPQTTDVESAILVTKLQADVMPMLRYEIGDIGCFAPGSRPGHPTLVLPGVIGRALDRVLLPNGGWIAGQQLPHLLKDFPVREFQFLQRADHSVQLQLVPGQGFDDDSLRTIRDTIAANLPGLQIEIELKESVVRTKSNKWRPVISEVRLDSQAFV